MNICAKHPMMINLKTLLKTLFEKYKRIVQELERAINFSFSQSAYTFQDHSVAPDHGNLGVRSHPVAELGTNGPASSPFPATETPPIESGRQPNRQHLPQTRLQLSRPRRHLQSQQQPQPQQRVFHTNAQHQRWVIAI